MKYSELIEVVERNNRKPLKEIMFELCILKEVIPLEGASILGVPEEVFIYWRNYYRFGPIQYKADLWDKRNEEQNDEYNEELKKSDLTRPLEFKDEISLNGFKEIIERYLEIWKAKKLINSDTELSDDLFYILEIGALKKMQKYIGRYESGDLVANFNSEAEFTSRFLDTFTRKNNG